MQLIRRLDQPNQESFSCALTIGNFDGVHCGHQALLKQLKSRARQLGLPSVLMTFEPHPKEFFHPESAAARLSNFREKFNLLRQCGVDKLVLMRFDEKLAGLSAHDFVKTLLIDGLDIKYLLAGEDFRFGCQRQGTVGLLREYARQFNFELDVFAPVRQEQYRISSSLIRDCLAQGDLQAAQNLLGYEYTMEGRVRHGDKRGRSMGFPTLNIALKRLQSPLTGVFAVEIHGIGSGPLTGVANLGRRPTVDGLKMALEVHVFDFNEEVYGKHVSICFKHKIRDEKKFATIDELKLQIQRDAALARELISG